MVRIFVVKTERFATNRRKVEGKLPGKVSKGNLPSFGSTEFGVKILFDLQAPDIGNQDSS